MKSHLELSHSGITQHTDLRCLAQVDVTAVADIAAQRLEHILLVNLWL